MKKFLAVILCILMVVSVAMFASCSDNTTDAPKEENPVEDVVVEDVVVADADDIETVKSKIAARKVNNKFAAALSESISETVSIDAEAEAVIEAAEAVEATSENPLLGTWKWAAMDIIELLGLEEAFASEGLEMNFSSFDIAILLSATEDEMVIAADIDSLEADAYEFCNEIIDGIGDNFILMLEEEGLTLADFEAEMGMTFDEFMDSMEAELMGEMTTAIPEMIAGAAAATTHLAYEIDGNTLVYEDGTSESFEVDGDTLTLYSGDMSLVFERV